MVFTNKQLLDIYYEGGCYDEITGEDIEVDVLEEGDWQVDHKMESSEVVFKHKDKFYRFYLYRYGSYWQGYEMEEPDGYEEVELAEKTITYWRVV